MADAATAAQAAKAKGNAAMSAGKWAEAITAFTEVRRLSAPRARARARGRVARGCPAAHAPRRRALPRPAPPPLARRPLR